MKIVQINSIANTGSTGRIAEGIGLQVLAGGHQSFLSYGRWANASGSELIKIGNRLDTWSHVIRTRLLDQHGRGSRWATKKFVARLEEIKPDVVHLHNIHGYFLNYEILFGYLKEKKLPVVWTLHDCWPFTGHCSYFDRANCEKWKTNCFECPLIDAYPKSFVDNSKDNFFHKKECFSRIERMKIVTPCRWLADLVAQSFLKSYSIQVIPYGIDLQVFRSEKSQKREPIVLGVAKPWSKRKGFDDFVKLRKILPSFIRIVLIGLNIRQIMQLPRGIEGMPPTESTSQLAEWYRRATVFVNPTYSDNFPVVNLEALGCGTPVITYSTGGSPEAVTVETGLVVPRGDLQALAAAICHVMDNSTISWHDHCRERAVNEFCSVKNYAKYVALYESI